jgi:hypothetical protein
VARLRLSGNEDGGRHHVRNILVGLPDLPQFGSTRSFALGNGVYQKDRLSHAWSTTALLMPAKRHVAVPMDDIRGARPVLLDEL